MPCEPDSLTQPLLRNARPHSFSQGAEWKAHISRYIAAIPPSGDASCVAEHIIAICPPPETPVISAMAAKVGAAARPSQSALRRIIVLLPLIPWSVGLGRRQARSRPRQPTRPRL
jgi:hypothetical protein